MAYSYVRYTSNGTTTNYTFSFPYISSDHIKVRVAGVLVTNWSFLNSSTIQFVSAPTSGSIIEIRRETPRDTVIVNFTDGSVLLERDLDLLATFDLYLAQENKDNLDGTITQDATDAWNGQNKRLASLAEPVNPQDAVTKSYADAVINTASSSAATATAAAASATNSSNSAAASATFASAKASEAASSASAAQNYVGNIIQNPIYGDDVFSGNGSTTAFTLSKNMGTGNSTALLVTISGVVQAPTAAYSVSGTTLTFTSAPPSGSSNIRVRYIGSLAVNAALADTAATNAANSATNAAASATSASNSASTATTALSNTQAAIAAAAIPLTSTSTTSLFIATGQLTLTTQSGKAWVPGHTIKIASSANGNNSMTGTVLTYNSTTGVMDVNVTAVSGSGTYASWSLSQATSSGGTTYTTLASGNIPTGVNTFNVTGVSSTYDIIKVVVSGATAVTGTNMGLSVNGYFDSSSNYLQEIFAFAPSGASLQAEATFYNKRVSTPFATPAAMGAWSSSTGASGLQGTISNFAGLTNSNAGGAAASLTNVSSLTIASYYGNNFTGGTYQIIGIKLA